MIISVHCGNCESTSISFPRICHNSIFNVSGSQSFNIYMYPSFFSNG